jgi:hypothetical protein
MWQSQKHQKSAVPFHQGSDGGFAILPDDEISLPMPGNGSVGRLRRSVRDHHHVAHSTFGNGASLGFSLRSPCAQASGQFLSQCPARLNEKRLIDSFV